MNPLYSLTLMQNEKHTEYETWAKERRMRKLATMPQANKFRPWVRRSRRASLLIVKLIQTSSKTSRRLASWFTALERKSVTHQIIDSTFIIFAHHHPHWVAACYDRHFFTHAARPLLEAFIWGDCAYSATELAQAWSNQFFYAKERQQEAVAQAEPIITEFLYILQTEVLPFIKNTQESAHLPRPSITLAQEGC